MERTFNRVLKSGIEQVLVAHRDWSDTLHGRLGPRRAMAVQLIVCGFWLGIVALGLLVGQLVAGSNTALSSACKDTLEGLPRIAVPVLPTMIAFAGMRAHRAAARDASPGATRPERIVLGAGLGLATILVFASTMPGEAKLATVLICGLPAVVSLMRLSHPGPPKELLEPPEDLTPGLFAPASDGRLAPVSDQTVLTPDPAAQTERASELEPPIPSDLPPDPEPEPIEEILRELDEDFIGLQGVKEQIADLIAQVQVAAARKSEGLSSDVVLPHLSFEGPPGTGKTTMARIVSRAMHSLGLLDRGHVVETTRADLVGEYQGHTARLVKQKLEEARGGVLFIDEAYSLVSGGAGDDFGREALATLIEGMERLRGELVVILAGYPDAMERLRQANPGLRSRIGRTIRYVDYSDRDLHEIGRVMLQEDYDLTPEADARLGAVLGELHAAADPRQWGNAREVRKLRGHIAAAQARRLSPQVESGELELLPEKERHKRLREIRPEDIDTAADRYRAEIGHSDRADDVLQAPPSL